MFTGRKIRLRKPMLEDAQYFQKWFMDQAFRQYYDNYISVSLDVIQENIKKMHDITDPNATRIDFSVLQKRTGEIIGVACIKDIDRHNGHAEISVGLGEKNSRLAGYGLDLMVVLLDVVFYQFGFEKCYLRVSDNNELGLHSAQSFGFVAEGKLRNHIFTNGSYVDQWIFGLTKAEYEQLDIVPKWKARNQ